ncbi:DUF3486 family protein [Edwardsiella anguillarum]|uniref:DUF3486 family protein n=2 Tax=Enterobacterales TaxID=91347 RepID=A0A761KW30_SALER|nr:DUF3486 family protein [Edwardsiella anguillarum]HAG3149548.1 DUF3486 family protein [Salmonella enterica]HDJ1974087.1 DUF3486 family protein [Salmonella enterica subsp. enterica]AIJ09273.1 Hypothetical protein ETEE_2840 [Edwardsiella anguillarum ET080813]KAB0589406.1 DUF3486 family protein [Edwardsiella anguillarum]WHQ26754.1 DUF3486 family protein [Edwardsiella anguillarum]
MEKKTRGRPSKIDRLPDAIRKTLFDMLREKQITQQQILAEVNRLIEDAGLPDEQKLSRSGLNRLATENEQLMQDLRELREQTKALTTELGDKPAGETSKLVLEMGRSLLFKAMRKQMKQANDPESEIDVDLLKNAMLAVQRLENTAMVNLKREKEIRLAYAEEAANAVSEELRGQDGMSEALEQRIRMVLLGKA